MQRGKTVLLLGLIVVCGWLEAGDAYAAVYYVAKTGLDGNPGTEAQPWQTIQKAAATMTAGDTAYVRSGTYNEQVTPVNSGNAGAWITLKAFPGDKVIIDGTGLEFTVQGLIQINGGIAYWDIEGFEIANSTWAGVQFYVNSNHHVLKDLTIHDTQISGIYAGGSSHLTIDGCEVYHTNSSGSQETITMSEVHDFEVRNCIVRNTLGVDSPVGVQKEGIDCKDGSANGLIHHNEIY